MKSLVSLLTHIIVMRVLRVSSFTCRQMRRSETCRSHWSSASSTDDPSIHDAQAEEEDAPPKRRRGRVRPLRRGSQLSGRVQAQKEESERLSKRREIAEQDPNLLVDASFSDFVSPPTARALMECAGVDRMTLVQGRTFSQARAGESLVVRAVTGSGKTLAFLVPLLERLLDMDPTQFQPGRQIGVLVVAPTRELAIQIADTAKEVIRHHSTLSVNAVYGGTSVQRDVRSLQSGLPSVLVATPGRLVDLIRDERIRGRKFADILSETTMVVLDEADLLIMGGFSKDVSEILSHLPREHQTMLCSATMPKKLQSMLSGVGLGSEWTLVDCVQEEKNTRPRIKESLVSFPPGATMDLYVPVLLTLIKGLLGRESDNGTKIMVFFPTVRMVRFLSDVFRECMKDVAVWEIHSHLSQSARRRVADSFRRTSGGVLLTSDISSRGMDYPLVDVVIQYGLPDRRDKYVHRIGRTGRAGKSGQAILVPMPFESLSGLGRMKRRVEEDGHLVSLVKSASSKSTEMGVLQSKMKEKQQPLRGHAEGCVLSLLAYYAENKPSNTKLSTIRSDIETFGSSIGLEDMPELSNSLLRATQKTG